MATTDSANTDNAAALGVSALLGLTSRNLFSNALGTNQNSGVNYGALGGQANALSLTALDSAQAADRSNQALVSNTIMPAVTNQIGVANSAASNMQGTAALVGGYSAADRAKAAQLNGATTQYAKEVTGYGINPVNGQFSGGAAGFWIENGKIAFPVQGLTIAGTADEILNGIDMMADDLDLSLSLAAPTVRIKVLQIGGE